MGRIPGGPIPRPRRELAISCWLMTAVAAVVGAILLLDSIRSNSATYDEVAYLRVAARWWRTGNQEEISRMGSPLTFWKLQQAPTLWLIDRFGGGCLIDAPIPHQEVLLPLVRMGGLWIWGAALAITALWARLCHGPGAMAVAAWLFALSPNLLAHGALATMELPLVAASAAVFLSFWLFLQSGQKRWFAASAAACGLAFSCKFTAAMFPILLGFGWWMERVRRSRGRSLAGNLRTVAVGLVAYVGIMITANLVVTGFALLPPSPARGDHPSIPTGIPGVPAAWIARLYETPLPQDWIGFATQVRHQLSGGSSYLLGERGPRGWRHYYLVALGVKVPLTLWILALYRLRMELAGSWGPRRDSFLLGSAILFLAITALGSSRNYGFRYLLPIAPLAIVWLSGVAVERGDGETRLGSLVRRGVVAVALWGQALAVAASHPFELTYFNALAGGPIGGRTILSDSNLDWGQGLIALARLQDREPGYRDLTLYYFGDTSPSAYGVQGTAHVVNATDDHSALPPPAAAKTRYLGVSASLQWGPWGPAGFFDQLRKIKPVTFTDDTTIAIYEVADLDPGSSRLSRARRELSDALR